MKIESPKILVDTQESFAKCINSCEHRWLELRVHAVKIILCGKYLQWDRDCSLVCSKQDWDY